MPASPRRRKLILALATLAAAVAIAAGLLWPRPTRLPSRAIQPSPTPWYRPPGPVDQPFVAISKDHQLDRVMHKDAHGVSPLEYVETPAGRVTIQRTFSEDGRLLGEKAFLDGKPVAVPAR